MAKSSIHIAKGGAGYLAHNSREEKTKNAIFDDEKNYVSHSKKEAFEIYRNELKIRSETYSKRTKQSVQKNTSTHLSAIVNFEKHHTPQDIQKVCDYLEKKLDTKVFQFAMHRDEGHIDTNGEIQKNYHCHIEFMGLDTDGNSVRRKMDKKFLINLQTEVALMLKMERGINYTKEKIKRPRRLDTYDFKAHKQQEAITVLAKVQDVKAQHKEEQKRLKESGDATGEQYKELREQYKELEAKAKDKDLTIEELKKTLTFKESLKNKYFEDYVKEESKVKNKDLDIDLLNQKIEELKKTLGTTEILKKHYSDTYLKEKAESKAKDLTIEELKEDKKYVSDNFKSTVDVLNDDINNLKKELELAKNKASGSLGLNSNLNEKVTDLENKLIEARRTIKELKEENVSLKDENNSLKAIARVFKGNNWFTKNNLEVNAENVNKYTIAVSGRVKELKEENVSLKDELMALKLSKVPEKIEDDYHDKFQRDFALENAKRAQEIIKEKRELTPAEKVDRFEAIVAKKKEDQEQGLSM